MTSPSRTLDQREEERQRTVEGREPGLVAVFSGGAPVHVVLPLGIGTIELGRNAPGLPIEDQLMSRRHASVSRERDGSWRVEDLGSRNGTGVDGRVIHGAERGAFRVLRTGSTLFLLVEDVRPYEQAPVELLGDLVMGAMLKQTWNQIRKAAAHSTLHITGETGSGKELAARAYHRAGPRPGGPFVAVNCAAIPEGVAERLLFGARKGAFSGATSDAEGYVQAADGGTLFLDEIGDLDDAVQAKLLRVLETREVMPLGASRPVAVDMHLCSATHANLKNLVAEKRFRPDLYYRIGRPHVAIPPLRERQDEIPHLVVRAVNAVAPSLRMHFSFIEACLIRPWPGNVRELLAEVSDAARHLTLDGEVKRLHAQHLAPPAGMEVSAGAAPAPARETPSSPSPGTAWPARDVILEALKKHGGRVTTAARALGLHRNQLRRWLATQDVDPRAFADESGEESSSEVDE